ncbi:MAG TPA: beta-propeller fold lactonase family protein, partial [Terriglobales bacterium]|nr:beta-propeller fold lactonase family protein [Terriglobales bacterium]
MGCSRRSAERGRAKPAGTAALALLLLAAGGASCRGGREAADTGPVGPAGPGRTAVPVNQILTPAGRTVPLAGLRPQALALSPDGRLLAVSGKTSELVILDPAAGAVLQRVGLPAEGAVEVPSEAASPNILDPDTKGQLSYTGLVFSPDGRRLCLSNVDGSIKVFAVDADGDVSPRRSLRLPAADAPRRVEEIPAGLAFSADGRKLYVCGNLSNRLLEIDAETGVVFGAFETGVAPYDVVLAGGKAYVSNWGGRRPGSGDLTGPAGQGTVVRVDAARRIASDGSVTVIDLAGGAAAKDIVAHLHSSALALSPDGRFLVCANAASDNLSVIDTATDMVVETVWVKASPADLFGASPNALAFAPDGRTLYVANGTQNAVAVIDFKPAARRSKLLGLIPAGWFPGAVVFVGRRNGLIVANIKGLPDEPRLDKSTGGMGFNSHQYHGSVSLIPVPKPRDLKLMTAAVYENYHRDRVARAFAKPRRNQPPRPVPERIGEPSVFEHVVYVIKENRTYDQVLGDVATGNGDPRLVLFGERVTPNQHKVAREFALLDNTYCSGILSADGHEWADTGLATDYMERSFAGFPRSYPDGMEVADVDALAYSPSGFIW